MRDLINIITEATAPGRFVEVLASPLVADSELPDVLRRGTDARRRNFILIYGAEGVDDAVLREFAVTEFMEQHGLYGDFSNKIRFTTLERSERGVSHERNAFWLAAARYRPAA